MISKAAFKTEPISMTPVCTTFLIDSQMPERNDEMPFQMPSKKDFALVQTAFQLVPNQPRNTSKIPRMISSADDNTPFTPSHTPEKIVLMPSHICDQFPVNSPINTSRMPVSASKTADRTAETAWKASSKIGASREQKPSQTAEMTSVMFVKLKPSSFRRSTMP